jgi:LysR family transcriptional regulator, glycine cleavage system transcriptional activator
VKHATSVDIPFTALNALDATCRQRSYSAAARELGLTRPAVSMAVARLEEQLGAKLFERTGPTITPTATAIELQASYAAARDQILRALNLAEERVHRVAISLPQSLAAAWLRTRLHQVFAGADNLEIHIHADATEPDFSAIDLAVTTSGALHPHLYTEHLFDEELAPVCSPRYAALHDLMKDEGAELTLLNHPAWTWSLWERARRGWRVDRARMIGIDDAGMVVEGVLCDLGIGLLPAVVAAPLLEEKRIVQVYPSGVSSGRRFFAKWLKADTRHWVQAMSTWLIAETHLLIDSDQAA